MLFKNKQKRIPVQERFHERYVVILPVEFAQLEVSDDQKKISWRQGYTCNLSESGLCLETVNLDAKIKSGLEDEKSMILIKILYPQKGIEINGMCYLRRMRTETVREREKYYLALQFHQIDKKELFYLLKKFRWEKLKEKIFLTLIILFFVGIVIAWFL